MGQQVCPAESMPIDFDCAIDPFSDQIGGPVALYSHELSPIFRGEPAMPWAARTLAPGEYRCRVKMIVDESGIPISIEVATCPEVLSISARRAAGHWRFRPAKETGKRVEAEFVLFATFTIGEGGGVKVE